MGEETDIVTKEMYTFKDRDETSLTLRPENTASVIRAYIEHRLDQRPGVQKLYYMGPMFRRERPQKGRYRQFFQIGAEAIGSESPVVDAEVIEMVVEILKGAGLSGFKLLINSVGDHNCRPQYVERLRQELKAVAPQMCGDCQRRAETNPLRVLDCKVEADQPIIDKLPHITDYLCDACRAHFEAVKQLSGRPRHRIRSPARAWCAAWTTTCAPPSKWCTARSARRIRCWAAAATTAWPNRWARKCTRRASDSRSAKTGW